MLISYLIVILYVFRPPKGQKFREPVASMNYYIPTQFTDNSILSYGPTSCSAAGLEHIQVLPFSIEGVEEAVSQAEEEGIDGPGWLIFSGFDISTLPTLDGLHLPIRMQIDDDMLILKMVSREHEAMHGSIMAYISGQLMAMGLLPALDYVTLGAARYTHHLNPDSHRQGDSSIGPAILDPWPATVIEAGWSEGVRRLRTDAGWWLSAQLSPNNPRLVVLISFKRSFP